MTDEIYLASRLIVSNDPFATSLTKDAGFYLNPAPFCHLRFALCTAWARSDAATALTFLGVLGLLKSFDALVATFEEVTFPCLPAIAISFLA